MKLSITIFAVLLPLFTLAFPLGTTKSGVNTIEARDVTASAGGDLDAGAGEIHVIDTVLIPT